MERDWALLAYPVGKGPALVVERRAPNPSLVRVLMVRSTAVRLYGCVKMTIVKGRRGCPGGSSQR